MLDYTRMSDLNIFLQETESIDYNHPIIVERINLLKEKSTSDIDYIRKLLENKGMPLVKIEMLEGKTPEYKKTVFDCVHEGLIDAFGIQDWDRFQRIAEYDKTNWETPEGKTENFMIIELTIFPGRTKEQKNAAIKIITEKLAERLDLVPTDVFIVMNEPPLENWGVGGNQKS